jgi:hypothetical protein
VEHRLERSSSVTAPWNAAARRVMEKAGLTYQGTGPCRGLEPMPVWYAIDRRLGGLGAVEHSGAPRIALKISVILTHPRENCLGRRATLTGHMLQPRDLEGSSSSGASVRQPACALHIRQS